MPEHAQQANLMMEIGACIVAATLLSFAARMTRQPLLLAYIAAGILIGPVGLKFIGNPHTIENVSKIGLAFLLFIVGLEIDLKKLVSSGAAAGAAATAQMIGSGVLGWLVALSLGYVGAAAIFMGIAIAFSSTMIIVKCLSDQAELDTMPGRMSLAITLLQDLGAIAVLVMLPQIGAEMSILSFLMPLVYGAVLIGGTIIISRYIVPHLFRFAAHSPEMLLLCGVTWCFLVCFAATKVEFSMEMGALLAGVSLSASPYSLDLVAKIRSLRDFFVTLFFVYLGTRLEVPTGTLIAGTVALSSTVILSRLIAIWPTLRLMGYDNRTGVLCSIHQIPISEFGLIVVLAGSAKLAGTGTDADELIILVIMTLVITSTLSTYLFKFSHPIAAMVMRRLSGTILEDSAALDGRKGEHEEQPIMLIGCFRIGSSLAHNLLKAGKKFTVVDFNPKILAELRALGVTTIYGDISNLDSLEHAGIHHAKILISCVTDDFLRGINNRGLLEALRRLNKTAKIVVVSESIAMTRELYAAGADYVLVPRLLSAQRLSEAIDMAATGDFEALREHDLAMLANRKEVVV